MLGGAFSLGHLLVVFAVALLIFGTKKLRTLGGDLGSAIRDFRRAMTESEHAPGQNEEPTAPTTLTAADIDTRPASKE